MFGTALPLFKNSHAQYTFVTPHDGMGCLQLHTVVSPHTVHASNPY